MLEFALRNLITETNVRKISRARQINSSSVLMHVICEQGACYGYYHNTSSRVQGESSSMATKCLSLKHRLHICKLLARQLTLETSAENETLQKRVLITRWPGKNPPHWSESALPINTYYMMELVCDVFRIAHHSTDAKYAYICDEVAAGPKSKLITPLHSLSPLC